MGVSGGQSYRLSGDGSSCLVDQVSLDSNESVKLCVLLEDGLSNRSSQKVLDDFWFGGDSLGDDFRFGCNSFDNSSRFKFDDFFRSLVDLRSGLLGPLLGGGV